MRISPPILIACAVLGFVLLSSPALLADGSSGVYQTKPHYPGYIYVPPSCGPKVDHVVPLYQPATKCEAKRAGWANLISPWAKPSNTCRYTGYYVGGGGGHCCGGRCRTTQEGTWGWDFQGGLIPRVVKLAWTFPSRYQGGEGQYKPDGPKFPSKTPENLFAPH